jgi:hypothetical protein
MTYAQLSAYLQAYLVTNDPVTLGNTNNFLSLAASRIKSDTRNALIEQKQAFTPAASMQIPTNLVAINYLLVDGENILYASPATFSEVQADSKCFTLVANSILVSTPLLTATSGELVYYAASADDQLAGSLPHLFLHAAAAEAYWYQGDTETGNNELALYQGDARSVTGWDVQGKTITLGGGAKWAASGF